jgi:hypothetical protein
MKKIYTENWLGVSGRVCLFYVKALGNALSKQAQRRYNLEIGMSEALARPVAHPDARKGFCLYGLKQLEAGSVSSV